jgi:N,N'-diacetyllegionaminate synthase
VKRCFRIGDRIVGDGHPAFIIAEVGINHNGNVMLAKEMVSAAWEAGADAVKIQTFITSEFLHPSHPTYQYDIDAQISHESECEIWDYAKKHGIRLFSTPEDLKSLAFLRERKPPLIKIAAMDFNFPILIKEAAGLSVPIILSSGMSTMEEVLRAVRWVEETGNAEYAILHCVSCYPTPPEECNLNAIKTLKTVLNGPVGYSDHTIGIHIPLAAVALGANIIEKHFTLDKTQPGPDQVNSMDPKDLSTLVQQVRELESSMGDGVKVPSKREAEPRRFKRRGIYAGEAIKAGQKLTEADVVFWAPSTADSSVDDWPSIEGRCVSRDIAKGSPISKHDLT